MCYSAATTSSMQNAKIGSEEMPFVEHLDTKCCSGGQGILIKRTVEYLQKNPEISVTDLKVRIQKWISRSRMVFVPGQPYLSIVEWEHSESAEWKRRNDCEKQR